MELDVGTGAAFGFDQADRSRRWYGRVARWYRDSGFGRWLPGAIRKEPEVPEAKPCFDFLYGVKASECDRWMHWQPFLRFANFLLRIVSILPIILCSLAD